MRVALVTGGATGIGSATVLALAKDNLTVALHYSSSKDAANRLAQQLKSDGANVEVFGADLSQPNAANDLVQQVKRQFGSVDILVNNAGY